MRPTGRGLAVVVVVIASLAMARAFGPRALNAVVAPLAVAALVGLIAVVRASEPTIDRRPVAAGFPGETRPVSLSIDGGGATPARIDDAVDDGLSATGNVATTTLTDDYRYEIELEERGEHELGPLSIAVTDAFGLVRRRFELPDRGRVLVYPRVYELRGDGAELRSALSATRGFDRGEFDHLREYERGDPVRDVHWTATAKRADDELLVAAHAADGDGRTATIVAEASPGQGDEMAAATASVATALLEAAVPVRVVTPEGTRSASGRDDRRALLELLATVGPGEVEGDDRREADVLVRADAGGTVVVVGDREFPFDRLCGEITERTEPARG